jgi:hypothetical protein
MERALEKNTQLFDERGYKRVCAILFTDGAGAGVFTAVGKADIHAGEALVPGDELGAAIEPLSPLPCQKNEPPARECFHHIF